MSLAIGSSVNAQSGWIQQSSGLTSRLSDVYFYNSQTGFVCGFGGKILKTTNGGINWVQQTTSTAADLYSIATYQANEGSPDTLYACGTGGTLLRTFNGGQNWINIPTGVSATLRSVISIMALSGGITIVVCGDNGTYRYSTNSGSAWQNGSNLPAQNLNAVHFINPFSGFVVGNNGTLGYTANIGAFSMGTAPGSDDLLDISTFNNTFDLYISTSTGKILRTTNLGSNWATYNTGVTTPLNTLAKISNKIWTAGSNGVIRYSSNSGASFIQQGPAAGTNYYSIEMIDDLRGFIVGDNGTILSTVNGGTTDINQISTEVPGKFSLSQNYPNPFNPSTSIEFALPKAGYVTLSVYNSLGKEVAILVNGELTAGIYKYDWTAGAFPGGTYFCRLSSEAFTETKKMLLVK